MRHGTVYKAECASMTLTSDVDSVKILYIYIYSVGGWECGHGRRSERVGKTIPL